MKTALCLAGDGARLPIKAGMLKAYTELGLKYDMLFGTSSGSLAGAIYHQGDLCELLDLCLRIRNKDVYYIAPLWNAFGPQAAFYNADPLYQLICKVVEPVKLRSNPLPFQFNITNLETLERVALDPKKCTNQEIWRGLLTSASVPVAFPLQQIGGQSYCDGGLTNDYCVGQAVLNGAERIILMTSLVAERKPIRNWIDALEQTISAGIDGQMTREIDLARKQGVEVIVIKPDKPTGLGILDFDYKDKRGLIDWGYKLAMDALKAVKV
jgi:NTE family protein